MNTSEDRLEKIEGYISRNIAVYQERNKDDQKTYFEDKKANECEVYFEWENIEKLGFGSDSSELYGFLCEMKQDGFIIDIKRKDLDSLWIIKKECFFITEERIKDKKKGYYFIRNGKQYWENEGEKVNCEEEVHFHDSGDLYYGDVILDTPPPIIMILVDKTFKKMLKEKDWQYDKIQITINPDEIYRFENKKRRYCRIKQGKAKIVKSLKKNKAISGKLLAKDCGYAGESGVSAVIKQLNEDFIFYLNVKEKLIINPNRSGYRLNREKYEIEFLG